MTGKQDVATPESESFREIEILSDTDLTKRQGLERVMNIEGWKSDHYSSEPPVSCYIAPMSITASQSRMARAALGWSIRETANLVHVGVNTLSRFETGGRAYTSTADSLRSAYESAGVLFVAKAAPSLAGGVGVRLVERP